MDSGRLALTSILSRWERRRGGSGFEGGSEPPAEGLPGAGSVTEKGFWGAKTSIFRAANSIYGTENSVFRPVNSVYELVDSIYEPVN
jgi:hypothetical protein